MPDARDRAAETLRETFRGPVGEERYLRLVRYADMVSRIHGWKAGAILPGSASPASIVHEVVVKVLDPSGTRTWDEKKEPSLLNALKGMIRSEIGHLYEKIEEGIVEPISAPLPDGTERWGDSFPSTRLHPEELNPEQHLLRQEKTRLKFAAMSLLLKEVEGNSDLELVFLALHETDSLSEVAAKTSLPIQRVYSARRELDRIVAKIPFARIVRAAREREEKL
jgi:hypothetical protein